MTDEEPAVAKTEGELAFEAYLGSLGMKADAFQEEVAGTTKRPDYRITLDGEPARFEVKQFDPQRGDFRSGFFQFDPYPPLREKINAARAKFKGLKGTASCSLVLYDNGRPLVFLDPLHVYGAMLGDVGFTFPIGDSSQLRQTFLGGGKMIRYAKGGKEPLEPQNTTISAIVVVSSLHVGSRRTAAAIAIREREAGRDLSLDERWAMLEEWNARSPGFGEAALRVRIYENPYAVEPLSRAFGQGPWDERFGPEGDRLVRLYVGAELETLEQEEIAAGIKVDPWTWL